MVAGEREKREKKGKQYTWGHIPMQGYGLADHREEVRHQEILLPFSIVPPEMASQTATTDMEQRQGSRPKTQAMAPIQPHRVPTSWSMATTQTTGTWTHSTFCEDLQNSHPLLKISIVLSVLLSLSDREKQKGRLRDYRCISLSKALSCFCFLHLMSHLLHVLSLFICTLSLPKLDESTTMPLSTHLLKTCRHWCEGCWHEAHGVKCAEGRSVMAVGLMGLPPLSYTGVGCLYSSTDLMTVASQRGKSIAR